MNISVFKLTTGEEIIARVQSAPEVIGFLPKQFTLEKPRLIGLVETSQGLSMNMTPWLIGNVNASINISSQSIIAQYSASDRLEKTYIEQTSSIKLT